jgi:hypothetical protein
MIIEEKFIISLILTLLIEIPLLFVLVVFFYKVKEISFVRIFFSGIIASTLTLPYFWFILPPFINGRYYLITGEGLVVLIESFIYMLVLPIRINRALLISFVLNLTSWILGMTIISRINF